MSAKFKIVRLLLSEDNQSGMNFCKRAVVFESQVQENSSKFYIAVTEFVRQVAGA